MDQTTALAKLRKILGPKMGYRIDKKALPADERDAASIRAREVFELRRAASEAMDARRIELLRDPAYQALRAEHQALDHEHSRLIGAAHHKRITVGIVGPLFFSIKADGDNWQEVVSKATGGKA